MLWHCEHAVHPAAFVLAGCGYRGRDNERGVELCRELDLYLARAVRSRLRDIETGRSKRTQTVRRHGSNPFWRGAPKRAEADAYAGLRPCARYRGHSTKSRGRELAQAPRSAMPLRGIVDMDLLTRTSGWEMLPRKPLNMFRYWHRIAIARSNLAFECSFDGSLKRTTIAEFSCTRGLIDQARRVRQCRKQSLLQGAKGRWT